MKPSVYYCYDNVSVMPCVLYTEKKEGFRASPNILNYPIIGIHSPPVSLLHTRRGPQCSGFSPTRGKPLVGKEVFAAQHSSSRVLLAGTITGEPCLMPAGWLGGRPQGDL